MRTDTKAIIEKKLEQACPSSLAAGQIPRDTVMAILAPLVDEIADLRVRVAALESDGK